MKWTLPLPRRIVGIFAAMAVIVSTTASVTAAVRAPGTASVDERTQILDFEDVFAFTGDNEKVEPYFQVKNSITTAEEAYILGDTTSGDKAKQRLWFGAAQGFTLRSHVRYRVTLQYKRLQKSSDPYNAFAVLTNPKNLDNTQNVTEAGAAFIPNASAPDTKWQTLSFTFETKTVTPDQQYFGLLQYADAKVAYKDIRLEAQAYTQEQLPAKQMLDLDNYTVDAAVNPAADGAASAYTAHRANEEGNWVLKGDQSTVGTNSLMKIGGSKTNNAGFRIDPNTKYTFSFKYKQFRKSNDPNHNAFVVKVCHTSLFGDYDNYMPESDAHYITDAPLDGAWREFTYSFTSGKSVVARHSEHFQLTQFKGAVMAYDDFTLTAYNADDTVKEVQTLDFSAEDFADYITYKDATFARVQENVPLVSEAHIEGKTSGWTRLWFGPRDFALQSNTMYKVTIQYKRFANPTDPNADFPLRALYDGPQTGVTGAVKDEVFGAQAKKLADGAPPDAEWQTLTFSFTTADVDPARRVFCLMQPTGSQAVYTAITLEATGRAPLPAEKTLDLQTYTPGTAGFTKESAPLDVTVPVGEGYLLGDTTGADRNQTLRLGYPDFTLKDNTTYRLTVKYKQVVPSIDPYNNFAIMLCNGSTKQGAEGLNWEMGAVFVPKSEQADVVWKTQSYIFQTGRVVPEYAYYFGLLQYKGAKMQYDEVVLEEIPLVMVDREHPEMLLRFDTAKEPQADFYPDSGDGWYAQVDSLPAGYTPNGDDDGYFRGSVPDDAADAPAYSFRGIQLASNTAYQVTLDYYVKEPAGSEPAFAFDYDRTAVGSTDGVLFENAATNIQGASGWQSVTLTILAGEVKWGEPFLKLKVTPGREVYFDNLTVTAVHKVQAVAADPKKGVVSSAGVVRAGDDITVTAVPVDGCTFEGWYEAKQPYFGSGVSNQSGAYLLADGTSSPRNQYVDVLYDTANLKKGHSYTLTLDYYILQRCPSNNWSFAAQTYYQKAGVSDTLIKIPGYDSGYPITKDNSREKQWETLVFAFDFNEEAATGLYTRLYIFPDAVIILDNVQIFDETDNCSLGEKVTFDFADDDARNARLRNFNGNRYFRLLDEAGAAEYDAAGHRRIEGAGAAYTLTNVMEDVVLVAQFGGKPILPSRFVQSFEDYAEGDLPADLTTKGEVYDFYQIIDEPGAVCDGDKALHVKGGLLNSLKDHSVFFPLITDAKNQLKPNTDYNVYIWLKTPDEWEYEYSPIAIGIVNSYSGNDHSILFDVYQRMDAVNVVETRPDGWKRFYLGTFTRAMVSREDISLQICKLNAGQNATIDEFYIDCCEVEEVPVDYSSRLFAEELYNELENGDLEKDVAAGDWGTLPEGMTRAASEGTADWQGDYALRVEATVSGGVDYIRKIPVKPSSLYTFAAWLKGTADNDIEIGLVAENGTGTYVPVSVIAGQQNAVLGTQSGKWERLGLTFETDEDCTEVYLVIRGTKGQLLLDNAALFSAARGVTADPNDYSGHSVPTVDKVSPDGDADGTNGADTGVTASLCIAAVGCLSLLMLLAASRKRRAHGGKG